MKWNSKFLSALLALWVFSTVSTLAGGEGWVAPCAITLSPDGKSAFIAFARTNSVLEVDLSKMRVARALALPANASGVTLDGDGKLLWVTCPGPQSRVVGLDVASGATKANMEAGHTASSPVLSPDNRTLYVCNRFNNDIGVYDLAARREVCRIPVRREPVAAVLTRDSKRLLVANNLPGGRSNAEHVGAVVSVVDTTERRVTEDVVLPSGSGGVNRIAISPDGHYAVVTHIAARFTLPTTQLERGWMNANAMTLIDVETMKVVNTILLDSLERGAANPWGVAFSEQGRKLVVTLAGTHELSVVDYPALMEKLKGLRPSDASAAQVGTPYAGPASRTASDVPNDLTFLAGIRERRSLGKDGLGPRAISVCGQTAFVVNYFSDTLDLIHLNEPAEVEQIRLGPGVRSDSANAEFGELCFNDARLCYQGWQSCSSCHPGHGRPDGLNWDLLNDGIGNARNTRSLLLAFQTPPAMSLGVRESAAAAVRAGVKHILFTEQSSRVYESLDAYVKSMQPVPSPHLRNGAMSEAAMRGKALFESAEVGCARCHPAPLFTDLKAYDVGTGGSTPQEGTVFDTPTLVEVWRTAPYLHDGSASMHEVLVEKNAKDTHGKTSHLTAEQIKDLATYILSL